MFTRAVMYINRLFTHDGNGHVRIYPFTKIGTYAVAPPEEMFILSSPDLLSATDPTKVIINNLLIYITALLNINRPALCDAPR